MMTRFLTILIFTSFSLLTSAQVSFGNPLKVNESWKFNLGDKAEAMAIGLDDTRWETVNLPHDWSVKGQLNPSLSSCTGYLPGGIGWYRKSIFVPASKKEKKIYIYFEGIYNRSEVFVNGQSVGKRPNGYISFMYDITSYVEFGKENLIAVRVDHSLSADSRWYTGSGIYRDVWLVYANPIHIDQWGVYIYPEVKSTKQALVHLSVEVKNNTRAEAHIIVYNELVYSQGNVVAKDSKKMQVPPMQTGATSTELKVKNPQFWSLDNPYLYTLNTKILQNDKIVDESITTTGIRSYTFDPDKGFALNGKWMKIKGVCLHHDAGVLGAASYKDVWKRRLLTLKELGVNAIRTSHNPQATHLYELCDEMGLLVMNEAFDEWEFPKRKWIEGWNVGTPGFQGAYDFFKEWGERDLFDMVKRDRNHVSIFAWSIGNEVDYPNDPYSHPVLDGGEQTGFMQPIFGGYKPDAPDAMQLGDIAKKLAAVVKQQDPSRPVTAGLAGVAMSNFTGYPGKLDIAGYNYTEKMYDSDHKKYPHRIIFGSENRHDYSAWKTVRDKEFIFGQFLWTGIDYLGESGRWPSRGFYSGLMDFAGFIKPRGHYRKALWSDKPVTYIGTYPLLTSTSYPLVKDVLTQHENAGKPANQKDKKSIDALPLWNYTEGQLIRVVCYTNAYQSKLILNDKLVGEPQLLNDDDGIIGWDIPYQPGSLKVIGMDKKGNQLCTYEIKTSKQPNALTVSDYESTVKQDGILQLTVQVVDDQGNPVYLSDNEITCDIEGNARLLGLESGNNTDMSDYTDNVHRVYHGKLLAIVQPFGNKKKDITIKFTSPWLQSTQIQVNVR